MKKTLSLLLIVSLYSARTFAQSDIFTDPLLAFQLRVPPVRLYKESPKNDSTGKIFMDMYHCMDTSENTYYSFGVRGIAPGIYVKNDSTFFADVRTNLVALFERLSVDTTYSSNGYIVMELFGKRKKSDRLSAWRYIAKGNRWYVLFADLPSKGPTKRVNEFFHSFNPLNIKDRPWQSSGLADSSLITWTPSPLVRKTVTEPNVFSYLASFDSVRFNTYNILGYHLNPYYWCLSDSAFWAQQVAALLSETDSLIYKKPVSNGDARGWEIMKLAQNSRMYQRKRILINGDRLYLLHTCALREDVLSENTDRFFEDFRFTGPVAKTHLFDPKTKELLTVLFSGDKKAATAALAFLPKAPFRKEDLPLLEEYFEKRPASGIDAETVNHRLGNCIVNIKDSSVFH